MRVIRNRATKRVKIMPNDIFLRSVKPEPNEFEKAKARAECAQAIQQERRQWELRETRQRTIAMRRRRQMRSCSRYSRETR
jgi:hypothetical protein